MAKLSNNEANLFDQKAADKHSAETGYNYEQKSIQQRVLHEATIFECDFKNA